MEEVIQVQEQYYILASSPRADENARVLKQGETFAVFNHFGDIQPLGLGEEGLYHEGTRFLNRLKLRINGRRPLLLSSTVREDNVLLAVDLTNPDISDGDEVVLPRDVLHIFRSAFLWERKCLTRLRLRSFALRPVEVTLSVSFEADFVDIFEVRGTKRSRRGRLLPPAAEGGRVSLAYEGLDGVLRRTRLEFDPQPDELSSTTAHFRVAVPPHGEYQLTLCIACEAGAAGSGPPRVAGVPFEKTLDEFEELVRSACAADAVVHTANEQLNEWVNRSASDLHLMVTETPHGRYPYAGIPWFSTAFGRDGIITALEYLWVNPELARGVLLYLAATQASEEIPEQDAEPGKILHETRLGEMAALGEIPFGRYYGTVDATPLFISLARAYFRRTADRETIDQIWPNILRALEWIDRRADLDGDGFVEYSRRSPHGLVTQGWKDSWDSVFHADGTLAEGPVALCEVQGYVFSAWRAAAELASFQGDTSLAGELLRRAVRLRDQFETAFWIEDLGTYALALDGRKQPCCVRASNAGHALFTGIARRHRAPALARTLLDDSSFSGWGIRTVASTEARYNPMSYHNGSIWPHDNALIAQGLARYGMKAAAMKVLTGLFDVSLSVDLHRLPELFCGFVRRPGQGPTLYPVACAPQAWAAGAVFLLLQACLGLSIHAPRRQIRFHHPVLPESIPSLTVANLRVGEAVVDLELERHPHDVGISIRRRDGDVEVVIIK
ncbi:MAG TPA: amylo-alpha-1,6-glucosidase [Planctomycetaceae bacterium]|nr:amylo-alpha-1,6-glucosidase [Planctomycetaceae bacterium]